MAVLAERDQVGRPVVAAPHDRVQVVDLKRTKVRRMSGICARPERTLYRRGMARTPQMNIRVPDDLRARLRAAARRRGVSQSILVRSALEHAASSPPDLPGPMPVTAPGSEQAGADTDFVTWIAGRAGLPLPLVRAGIARGWVRVDGRECRDPTGGAWHGAAEVTFDGRPV